MSNLDFQKRTCSNYVATFMMKHPSSSGGVSNVEAVADLAPLIDYKSQESNEILEPTPFRECDSLQPLPHSGNIFVPMAPPTKSPLEPCISSAIACISGSCQPSAENNVEHTEFSDVDTILALFPLLPATIRDTMPMGVAPAGNIRTSTQSTKNWEERFQQLLQFKAQHGHCLVPHDYPENPSFARWAKRQRFQYKLLRNHKPSVMTEERVDKLESVGFVWDPQTTAWVARLMDLQEFKMAYGHCNVPCRYPQNPALGAWVKRQRRQYKKYVSGAPTCVSPDRFRILTEMGFQWEIIQSENSYNKRVLGSYNGS